MSVAPIPTIFVISMTRDASEIVSRCFPSAAQVAAFAEPAEALRALQAGLAPLLMIVELGAETRHWVPQLERFDEVPTSPRRLFLVSPAQLEEVLHDLYRPTTDHLLLWPCDDAEIRQSLQYVLMPPATGVPAYPLPSSL